MSSRKLRNLLSPEDLRARLEAETEPRVTFSFYRYANITEPELFRNQCYLRWSALDVFGRVYIATEGINGQVSVPASKFEAFKAELYSIDFMDGIMPIIIMICICSVPTSILFFQTFMFPFVASILSTNHHTFTFVTHFPNIRI